MGRRVTKSKATPPTASVASGSLDPQSSALNRSTWLLAALLALMTTALYWPATHHDFVNYDDPVYVTLNTHIQAGLTLPNLEWAFFRPDPVFGYWHPLTLLSHMLDCQLYDLHPWGHHLTSILLHALNAALVLLWLQQMTGALWRSAMVAALFAVHPLHVESVAWIAERKGLLCGFFGLLSLIFYTRYAQLKITNSKLKIANGGCKMFYGLSILFFALGLMSKPMLVTWPFVMLLLDWWPLGRSAKGEVRSAKSEVEQPSTLRSLLLEKIPFFVLVGVSGITTLVISKKAGALSSNQDLPYGARVANALISYCRYLEKLVWPSKLAVFYTYPGHWPMAEVLLAAGLLSGLTALFFLVRQRYPFLLVGWLWFIGTLVPVMGIIQVSDFAMADRYTYIPSLGALIMVVWGAYEVVRRWNHRVLFLALGGSAAIVFHGALTVRQLGYWQNSETLFEHALAVGEDSFLAHNNLGTALYDKGLIDEAFSQFRESVHLKPDYAYAHNNLGNALNKKDRVDEAVQEYQAAIQLKPDFAEARFNLGFAWYKKGRTDEAISQFQKAISVKPDMVEPHFTLGNALLDKGRIDEAIVQFQEVIRLKPDYAEAHNNLGTALGKKGGTGESIGQYREAIRLKPDFPDAHFNLGNELYAKGGVDEAISEYEQAIRLKPDYAEAHDNLGIAFARQGRIDEAITQFEETVHLRPDNAGDHDNLGTALLNKGRIDEAISRYQEALRLNPSDTGARDNLARALAMKNTAPGKAEPSNH